MPYIDPNTVDDPTTGQPILAAWGDVARDALEYLARNFPHCSVFNSASQAVAHNAVTALTANSENSDVGGMHSTSVNTERVTIPAGEGGLYRVDTVVRFAAVSAGQRLLAFNKNGAVIFTVALCPVNSAAVETVLSGGRSIVLAAGDYVTVTVYQDSGNPLFCTLSDFSLQWRAVA